MDLNEIAVFTKVAQLGSFSQAAKLLGMPNSTVSTKVSLLERRLGVTLLQRTTRRLHLTQPGEAYLKSCLEALETLHAAESEVTAAQRAPQGTLRITAPVDMGHTVLPNLIRDYVKKYPDVSVELLFSDQVVDLVSEGIDLAVRAGELEDSSLIARKLGYSHFAPFASPAYLKAAFTPNHPRQLADLNCLRFMHMDSNTWTFLNGKQTSKVKIKGSIAANDILSLKALALSGQGVALLPTFICQQDIKKQHLIRILPEWFSHPEPMHLVYPPSKFTSPKTASFIELAIRELKPLFETGL